MQQRKIPMRKCLGCNASAPKRMLLRIVRSVDGEIEPDVTGKKAGRGAYVCFNPDCVEKLRKSKRLSKVFAQTVPDSVYESIIKEMENVER